MSFRKRTPYSAPSSTDSPATLPESDAGPRAAGPLAFVAGTLHSVTEMAAVVLCGGMGWRLICPDSTLRVLPAPGKPVTLHSHLHLFEGGVTLYGFATRGEQQVFELVTQVSGVSRMIAVGMLSAQSPREIVQALATGNVLGLTRSKGLGKKKAEKLILALKDEASRFALAGGEVPAARAMPVDAVFSDAIAALMTMGLTPQSAEAAVREARERLGADAAVNEIVRAALTASIG